MPRNEEGEFELVLGNKQLLSVFFVVVALMFVFFTMGYIVGRSNSPEPVQTAALDPKAGPPGKAIVVDPSQPEAAPAERPSPTTPAPSEPPPAELAKPAATKPPVQEPAPAPEPVKPKPEPPKPSPEPVKTLPEPATGGLPQAGATYLQVAAIDRAGADILAETLRKKSFPSLVAPGPSPAIFRVLVGPVQSKEHQAQMKQELENVGLKGPIVRQY
jgi:cell division septation protein DedD